VTTVHNPEGRTPGVTISRRSVLVTLGVLTGIGGAGFEGSATATAAADRSWTRKLTQNGWSVITKAKAELYELEGTDAAVRLRPGPVSTVLRHVARRFHYEVSALESGDVHGYSATTLIAAPLESNYLSGTAIAIRPQMYPAGSNENLFPLELLAVRDILAECEGVVRWGGDDEKTPKEGHFQIDVAPGDAALARIAARIAGWRQHPGRGAGTIIDLAAPKRQKAALKLQRKQS
jgi:hypothetical protein